MKAFVITQGSGPMYQRGEHSLLIGRVMVGVGMEIENYALLFNVGVAIQSWLTRKFYLILIRMDLITLVIGLFRW
jgi:hypothetical protein